MSKTAEKYRKWMEDLYWNKGLSIKKIGKILGISYFSVIQQMKKMDIPRRPAGIRNYPNLDPSPHIAFIIGVLFGDGCVCVCQRTHYTIALQACDKEFVLAFKNALETIGLKGCWAEGKTRKWYAVKVSSKIFYDWYKGLSWEEIEEFLKDRDMKIAFVRGFFDSDGNVHLNKKNNHLQVEIDNTKKEKLLLTQKILNSLGFNSKIYVDKRMPKRKDMFRLVIMGGNKESKKFLKTIEPTIPRKRLMGVV